MWKNLLVVLTLACFTASTVVAEECDERRRQEALSRIGYLAVAGTLVGFFTACAAGWMDCKDGDREKRRETFNRFQKARLEAKKELAERIAEIDPEGLTEFRGAAFEEAETQAQYMILVLNHLAVDEMVIEGGLLEHHRLFNTSDRDAATYKPASQHVADKLLMYTIQLAERRALGTENFEAAGHLTRYLIFSSILDSFAVSDDDSDVHSLLKEERNERFFDEVSLAAERKLIEAKVFALLKTDGAVARPIKKVQESVTSSTTAAQQRARDLWGKTKGHFSNEELEAKAAELQAQDDAALEALESPAPVEAEPIESAAEKSPEQATRESWFKRKIGAMFGRD